MNIIIQATKKEKRNLTISGILLIVLIYFINRRYLYILDAEFENGLPTAVTLKVGFIFPVKKYIRLKNGESGKIKLYGYTYYVEENKKVNGFDVLLKNHPLIFGSSEKKKIGTIYPDSYYTETKKLPTGRLYFR